MADNNPVIAVDSDSVDFFGPTVSDSAVINLFSTDNVKYVGLTVPAAGSVTSYTMTLPGAQGAASSVLSNDGAGALSWSSIASLGGVTSVTGTANQINSTGGTTPVLSLSSTTVFPGTVTLNADPTTALEAATKQYVDAIASGITVLPAANVATTAALNTVYNNGAAGVGATLTNNGAQVAFSVDGQTPGLNSIVLVKDQAAQEENGIYTLTDAGSGATNWVLTRSTSYDAAGEINPGDLVPVSLGTVNGGSSSLQSQTVTTVGTDPIIFTQFTAANPVLTVSGTSNRITSTGGQNPVIDISAAYVGQASITTVGALASGSLVAGFTPVTVPIGGTGASSFTAYSVICAGTTSTGTMQNVSGVGTSGQILTSNGAAALPTWQTPVTGTIWVNQNSSSVTMVASHGYIINNGASLVTLTLPASAAYGDTFIITGYSSGGWLVAQNGGQTVHFNSTDTTAGAGGSLASTNRYNCIRIVCVIANTDFTVDSSSGSITVV